MSNHSLLASWWQSLSLLRWLNLKLFLLVSLKTIKDHWKLLLAGALLYAIFSFMLFRPFLVNYLDEIIGNFIKNISLNYFKLFNNSLYSFNVDLVYNFFNWFFVAFCCFILRPSVDNKSSLEYYKRFLFRDLLPVNLMAFLLATSFFFQNTANFAYYLSQKIPYFVFLFILLDYFFLITLYAGYLFLFDAPKKESFKFIHAFYRGLVFSWYNFPLLIIGLAIYAIINLVNDLFLNKFVVFQFFFGIANSIVFLAFISTIYTKKVYEQYELYFSKQ
jgi:hypothetical protein